MLKILKQSARKNKKRREDKKSQELFPCQSLFLYIFDDLRFQGL